MTVKIVRLGTERGKDEGLRIGTVRRPPRGVPKTEFAAQNWYDVWYPNLAPSAAGHWRLASCRRCRRRRWFRRGAGC